jgi:hypothetical protein
MIFQSIPWSLFTTRRCKDNSWWHLTYYNALFLQICLRKRWTAQKGLCKSWRITIISDLNHLKRLDKTVLVLWKNHSCDKVKVSQRSHRAAWVWLYFHWYFLKIFFNSHDHECLSKILWLHKNDLHLWNSKYAYG